MTDGYMLIGGERVATVNGVSIEFAERFDHWTKPPVWEKVTINGQFSFRLPSRRWRKKLGIDLDWKLSEPRKRPSRGYAKHLRRQKAAR